MRIWHSLALSLGLLLPAACGDNSVTSQSGSTLPPLGVRLQEVFGSAAGLSSPMDLQAPPGDARLFIAERPGRIRIVQGGVLLTPPFLDISSRVLPFVGEDGLLSFTFHPQFASGQPFVFVHFVEKNLSANGDIVVERYQVSSSDRNVLDVSSVQPVIRIPHPDDTHHYGGRVAFGPDGMLYLSAGDGGGSNNQFGHAQDAGSRLGKLLRLDVSTLPYAIPAGNPVWLTVGQNENWAIGLRNPFRYAFDAAQLYIADVGQAAREEIDLVSASASGLNYGWSIMEGTVCLAIGGPCTTSGLTAPVYDYDHSQGCAIIGGYVYRGAAIPGVQGQYVFSDYCSGFVRSLMIENGTVTVRQAQAANAGSFMVQSFGQDGAGELYILNSDGRVLRIVRQ